MTVEAPLDRLILQLKHSQHHVTTAKDEQTGRIYHLKAVQLEEGDLQALIACLEEFKRARDSGEIAMFLNAVKR